MGNEKPMPCGAGRETAIRKNNHESTKEQQKHKRSPLFSQPSKTRLMVKVGEWKFRSRPT
jgi:hypothetical protein